MKKLIIPLVLIYISGIVLGAVLYGMYSHYSDKKVTVVTREVYIGVV